MATLVALLGTIAVVLTFVGVFRVSSTFLSGGPVLAAVPALAATVAFVIVFEYLILVLGLAVLAAPVAVAYRYRGRFSGIQRRIDRVRKRIRARLGRSGTTCGNCGARNEQSDQYCKQCGTRINTA